MSDEPRDGQSDGDADPATASGGQVLPGNQASSPTPDSSTPSTPDPGAQSVPPVDPPAEDTRTDGSRTDVSAPWERPRRWERTGMDPNRVDALLARLGDDGDDDAPDSRRNRRKNNDDSDAVPASALIAALGEAAADGPAGSEATVDEPASGEVTATEADSDATAPAGAGDGDSPPRAGSGNHGPTDESATDESAADDAPDTDGPADDHAAEWPTDPADDTAITTAGTHEDHDAHTGPLPRAGGNAAELAEASSIRAALDRQAGVGASKQAAAPSTAPSGKGRKKAATAAGAAGATLVHGANQPRGRHRGFLYAGRGVAAFLALLTLVGIGWNWKIKDRAEVGLQSHQISGSLPTADPSISTARTTPVVVTNSQGVKTTESAPPKTVYQPENILLLGSDTRAGGNAALGGTDSSTEGVANSDTLMVAHISGDREHVTVLSIPRDTIITTPACRAWSLETGKLTEATPSIHGGKYSHINTLYAVGGPQCTAAGVQSLTGLGITRIIGIDFDGFKAMVDALGGITVNVCKPIQDEVLGTVVAAGGVQVIKGAQAISLVRARDVIGDTQSDLARIRRQQVVLSAILRQVTQAGTLLNPVKLDAFLQAFVNNTFTLNVKLDDLINLAGSLGTLDPARVTFYTLPTVPSTTVDGALDVDKAKALPVFDVLINDLPLPGQTTPTAKPKPPATSTAPVPAPSLKLTVAPSKVVLELYNVSGRDNVAGMAQQELNAAGFSIDDDQLFRPDRTQNATQVQFAPTNRAAALTVAAAVPGSTLVVTPGLGSTVRLQLGSSFAGVIKTVAVGQQAPPSLSTAISTGASVKPSTTAASTALSSVNAGAGTCA